MKSSSIDEHIEPYCKHIIALETTRKCAVKNTALRNLAELGDRRALPALERLSTRTSKRQRFVRRRKACHAEALEKAIEALAPENP